MSAITANYLAPAGYYDRAVSKESAEIRQGMELIKRKQGLTLTFGDVQRLSEDVVEAHSKCSAQDWDGYGSPAISKDALAAALKLASLLPNGSTVPEIVPEPSGSLGFLWSSVANKTFSITATPEGQIVFAGILGKKEISGQAPFYDELPQEVLIAVREFAKKI